MKDNAISLGPAEFEQPVALHGDDGGGSDPFPLSLPYRYFRPLSGLINNVGKGF